MDFENPDVRAELKELITLVRCIVVPLSPTGHPTVQLSDF